MKKQIQKVFLVFISSSVIRSRKINNDSSWCRMICLIVRNTREADFWHLVMRQEGRASLTTRLQQYIQATKCKRFGIGAEAGGVVNRIFPIDT